MKSLWNLVCILAVANLLGLMAFGGWLWASDRLSWDRLRQVRETLAPTNAEEVLVEEQQAKQESKAQAEAAEKKRMEGPPESASERIERNKANADAQAQAQLRTQREHEDLGRTLMLERQVLDAQRAELAAERKKFEETRAAFEEQTKSEQFKQALATLEAQKPKDAHGVLKALLDAQKGDEVISYLAAMNDRPRAKVMAEFVKADEKLAAELLEQLRQRGVHAPQASAKQP